MRPAVSDWQRGRQTHPVTQADGDFVRLAHGSERLTAYRANLLLFCQGAVFWRQLGKRIFVLAVRGVLGVLVGVGLAMLVTFMTLVALVLTGGRLTLRGVGRRCRLLAGLLPGTAGHDKCQAQDGGQRCDQQHLRHGSSPYSVGYAGCRVEEAWLDPPPRSTSVVDAATAGVLHVFQAISWAVWTAHPVSPRSMDS